MATLDLRWFTNEESLRSITAKYLLRLLAPHAEYLRGCGLAQYTRDHDSIHIEEWLARRGFIIQREVPTSAEAVLASA